MRSQRPEWLRLEGSDCLMALNTEIEGRSLTRPIGDHTRIQVPILALEITDRLGACSLPFE